jgi:hypothetical protein
LIKAGDLVVLDRSAWRDRVRRERLARSPIMGEGVEVRPDQVSLGVLVSAVPRDAVDEAVAVCGVREKRSDAKLPAHVITYLTLALCLFPDDDYREVTTKVTGSLDRWGCWNAFGCGSGALPAAA